MRVMVLDFLETDIFNVSAENCVTFLDPMIESWDIDLATFSLEIVLRRRGGAGGAGGAAAERVRRFELVERNAGPQPGLEKFLADSALSGRATSDELEFLKGLRFQGRRPTALYYYRELQNLRDPLHFENV